MPTIDLPVNGYTADVTDWYKIGSPPYINVEGGGYIYGWNSGDRDGFYTFEDMPMGTPTACRLYGRVKGAGINSTIWVTPDNWVNWFIWNGTIGTEWEYVYADAWGFFNTRDKINNARVGFHQPTVSPVYVDYAFLRVTYTPLGGAMSMRALLESILCQPLPKPFPSRFPKLKPFSQRFPTLKSLNV